MHKREEGRNFMAVASCLYVCVCECWAVCLCVCVCIVDALEQVQRGAKLFMCRTFNLYMAKYILHLQNALPSLSSDSSQGRRGSRQGATTRQRHNGREDQALARQAAAARMLGHRTQGLALFLPPAASSLIVASPRLALSRRLCVCAD